MAGAGYKLFNTGDVLTAAQVNTYLQEQTVMVFASSAARTTALSGVLAEGMMSYLQDTNSVEVYNGSAWTAVGGGGGDVTEVQAGTGISVASGTGPIPVVTNTMATAIDAEGDLIIGDAADAFQRLPIGSNTHVLTVDTSVDGKIKWAAPAGGGGKVLQVVYGSTSTEVTNATTSFADSGLSASITPSLNTSKVLVLIAQQFIAENSTYEPSVFVKLLRGATTILQQSGNPSLSASSLGCTDTNNYVQGIVSLNYLDSPSTTSATTYKTQFVPYRFSSVGQARAQQASECTSTMILLEIGA